MATKFLVLPFGERVVRKGSLYNILINGKPVGVNVDLMLNYYRGLHLSCIDKLEITIDSVPIAPDSVELVIHDKQFSMSDLPQLFAEFWGTRTPLHIRIMNGGLAEGEHIVDVRLELRNETMIFAPGVYGMVDASGHAELTLGEGREI